MNSSSPFLYDLWCDLAGVPSPTPSPRATLEEIYASQWSPQFEQLMRNRLAMGYFRYGPLDRQAKGDVRYDNCGSAIARIDRYRQSGNTEHLVDAANLMLVEFVTGHHPRKHFSAADDGIHTERKR